MAGKPNNKKGHQQGTQDHAEGQHGEKTHAAFLEQLESGPSGDANAGAQASAPKHPTDGEHRLFEGREQHDEAEVQSEKNRLERDIEEHGHDRSNFQVTGGAASARAMPPEHVDPEHPDR